MRIEKSNVLGIGVSAINMSIALTVIDEWIKAREQQYICLATVHGIIESQQDEKLQHIYNSAGLVTPDGMPLVWLGRINGYKYVNRVYGPDLMLAVCEESLKQGYKHFFYGGAEGVADLLAANLATQYVGLEIVGAYSPPFRPLTEEEDKNIVQMINEANPDIVWVGLGAPRQEYWMATHLGRVNAPIMLGVGAAFDFHAGVKRQAPLWMQRSGFEWLFRLLSEPKRLWRRYLINNPIFLVLIVAQKLGLRYYALPDQGRDDKT